jgi:hypothetical protein
VNVGAGGRFDAAATLVEGNSSTGLFAIDPQSAIYGIQLVVRGTLADARTGDFGRGIEVDTEALLDCEGCVLTGNLDAGLVVDDGGIATLRQTVVADNRPRTSDGRYGRGMMVQGGGRLDASGLLLAGHTDLALYLSDPVTEAALTDLVVAGPAAAVDRLVSIQAEAAADLQRARIVGDALLGIYVGTGALVAANDLQLEGRGAAELAETARLLEVSRGGALTGLRVALLPTQGGGALVTETVFAWPGVGRLLVTAVGMRDLAVVQTIVLLVATTMVGANYLVDIAYGLLDPRIRASNSAGTPQ